jgi:hypothetical protein
MGNRSQTEGTKGWGHEDEFFFFSKVFKLKSVLSVHTQKVFKILDCLFKLKSKLIKNFNAFSLKTLVYVYGKDCSESHIKISVLAFLFCHWSIFSSVQTMRTCHSRLSVQYKDHRGLS